MLANPNPDQHLTNTTLEWLEHSYIDCRTVPENTSYTAPSFLYAWANMSDTNVTWVPRLYAIIERGGGAQLVHAIVHRGQEITTVSSLATATPMTARSATNKEMDPSSAMTATALTATKSDDDSSLVITAISAKKQVEGLYYVHGCSVRPNAILLACNTKRRTWLDVLTQTTFWPEMVKEIALQANRLPVVKNDSSFITSSDTLPNHVDGADCFLIWSYHQHGDGQVDDDTALELTSITAAAELFKPWPPTLSYNSILDFATRRFLPRTVANILRRTRRTTMADLMTVPLDNIDVAFLLQMEQAPFPWYHPDRVRAHISLDWALSQLLPAPRKIMARVYSDECFFPLIHVALNPNTFSRDLTLIVCLYVCS